MSSTQLSNICCFNSIISSTVVALRILARRAFWMVLKVSSWREMLSITTSLFSAFAFNLSPPQNMVQHKRGFFSCASSFSMISLSVVSLFAGIITSCCPICAVTKPVFSSKEILNFACSYFSKILLVPDGRIAIRKRLSLVTIVVSLEAELRGVTAKRFLSQFSRNLHKNVSPYTFIVVVYPQFRQTYGMMMTISLALYLSTPTFTLSKSSIIFVVLPALGQLK